MSRSADAGAVASGSAGRRRRHAARGWASRLRWFLAEFVVVVAGVLVALAVSSLAQDRQDRQREQAYLRQLSADLTTSERELAGAVDFLRQRALAAARVTHRFWRDDIAVDDALLADMALPRSTRRFRPVLGTAEALISSGDLRLIQSDTLRSGIPGYVEAIRTRLDDVSRYDETYYRPSIAVLGRGPDFYQFARFTSQDDTLRWRPNRIERVPFPSTLDAMLRDRDVYDGYSGLLIAHRNQSAQYADMLALTRALHARVEAGIHR